MAVVVPLRPSSPIEAPPPAPTPPPATRNTRALIVRAAVPLVVGGVIVLLPVPEGLTPTAWRYFALFAAVIAGVITEPLPRRRSACSASSSRA